MGILLALSLLLLLSGSQAQAERTFGHGSARLLALKPARLPSRAIVWNNRGVDLYSAKKYAEALQAFDEALKIAPGYADAYSNRGAANDALDHPELAVADYSQALKLDPSKTSAFANRAAAYCDLGRFNEALQDLDVVISHDPTDSHAYNKRGFCYKSLGDLQSALADFEMAVKYNKHLQSALENRDFLRKALQAGSSVEPAVVAGSAAKDVTNPPAGTGTAVVSNAVSIEKPVVDPSVFGRPNNNVPAAVIGPLDAASEPARFPQAGKSAIPWLVVPLANWANVGQHVIGNVLFACGQYQLAEVAYSEAIAANPRDAFAYFRRGNALMRRGQTEKAIADFDMAVRINPRFRQASVKRDRLVKQNGPE